MRERGGVLGGFRAVDQDSAIGFQLSAISFQRSVDGTHAVTGPTRPGSAPPETT